MHAHGYVATVLKIIVVFQLAHKNQNTHTHMPIHGIQSI
jgi:hypothetical protein